MSYLAEQEMACPYCKHPNEVEVWSVINVKDDPELKDLLLGGEINLAECAACKKIFFAEFFLLYHDPSSELMAFVYPREQAQERQKWEEKMKLDFVETQAALAEGSKIAYAPVALFGLDELVKVVEMDDETVIQGEIVQHIAKEQGLSVKTLGPAAARALKFPSTIPYRNGAADHKGVAAGLEEVLKANDRLTLYADFQKRVRENPGLDLKALNA